MDIFKKKFIFLQFFKKFLINKFFEKSIIYIIRTILKEFQKFLKQFGSKLQNWKISGILLWKEIFHDFKLKSLKIIKIFPISIFINKN